MLPWLLAIPPVVALGVIGAWLARPDLHRDATLRGALIVSVCVAGIEVLLGALAIGFMWLVSTSNLDF
jgi:hypothetical protein